jgi:methylmalonyl-CoA mutase
MQTLAKSSLADKDRLIKGIQEAFEEEKLNFDPKNWEILQHWDAKKQAFKNPEYQFKVRDKVLSLKTHTESLSHSQIPKVAAPRYSSWGDILRWVLQENFPGEFPYTAGLFPFKREGEDPTRMFAGEGGPERTNSQTTFHGL